MKKSKFFHISLLTLGLFELSTQTGNCVRIPVNNTGSIDLLETTGNFLPSHSAGVDVTIYVGVSSETLPPGTKSHLTSDHLSFTSHQQNPRLDAGRTTVTSFRLPSPTELSFPKIKDVNLIEKSDTNSVYSILGTIEVVDSNHNPIQTVSFDSRVASTWSEFQKWLAKSHSISVDITPDKLGTPTITTH